MQEDIIQFETAILAKTKGFDVPVLWSYGLIKETCSPTDDHSLFDINTQGMYGYSAPTQSLMQRWLREEHNIMIAVYNNASGYLWNMADTAGGTDRGWSDCNGPNESGVWNTYELALEAALLEGLSRIQTGGSHE
jgi:hypothetical protein